MQLLENVKNFITYLTTKYFPQKFLIHPSRDYTQNQTPDNRRKGCLDAIIKRRDIQPFGTSHSLGLNKWQCQSSDNSLFLLLRKNSFKNLICRSAHKKPSRYACDPNATPSFYEGVEWCHATNLIPPPFHSFFILTRQNSHTGVNNTESFIIRIIT